MTGAGWRWGLTWWWVLAVGAGCGPAPGDDDTASIDDDTAFADDDVADDDSLPSDDDTALPDDDTASDDDSVPTDDDTAPMDADADPRRSPRKDRLRSRERIHVPGLVGGDVPPGTCGRSVAWKTSG
ncbi:hypothetical protein L6R50_18105 [Myxococcota bacterium]|nr:hypothetical protein [Myxococcota bacterium]